MSKNIAVFFSNAEPIGYPFNKQEYLRSYYELNCEVSELGNSFYIVRNQATYLGNGIFSKSWQFDSIGQIIDSGEIEVDVIYDKGRFESDNTVLVLNSYEINEICTSKWKTYQKFKNFSPNTCLVHNFQELKKALNNIDSDIKVVKPVDGEEGKNVHIDNSENLLKLQLEYPLLVQEFLDSSIGIPGLVNGIHDFRIALLDGEIVYSFLRTPPSGELKANVALGGSLFVVDKNDIPEQFKDLAMIIDASLESLGSRLYGVDLALTSEGPKIIELNSRLGLQENARHPIFKSYKQKLAKKLSEM